MKQQDNVCKKTETTILFLTLNVPQFAAASQAFTFQRSFQDTCTQQVGAGTPRWLRCSIRDLSITLCWTNCCHINYHYFSKKRENIYGVFFPLNKPIKLYVIAIKKQTCLRKNLQTDPEGQSTDWNFFFFSDFPVLREESRCSWEVILFTAILFYRGLNKNSERAWMRVWLLRLERIQTLLQWTLHMECVPVCLRKESWAKDPSQKMGIVPEQWSRQQPDLNTF